MKAILEFNLDEREDQEAHLRAVKALDMALVIHDIFNELRKDWKYSEDDNVVEAAEKYRQAFYEICEAHDVNIDELLS